MIVCPGSSYLPGLSPSNTAFILGLEVLVLKQGQNIDSLPYGAGIQMDFPLPDRAQDRFAVLYWDDPDEDGDGE